MFALITAAVVAISMDSERRRRPRRTPNYKYRYWLKNQLKENGWTEKYTVQRNTLYLTSEKDRDKHKHRGTNYFIDPIEVLLDVKTSVSDPKYVIDWSKLNTLTKLPSEKPGHTLFSLKCPYNC